MITVQGRCCKFYPLVICYTVQVTADKVSIFSKAVKLNGICHHIILRLLPQKQCTDHMRISCKFITVEGDSPNFVRFEVLRMVNIKRYKTVQSGREVPMFCRKLVSPHCIMKAEGAGSCRMLTCVCTTTLCYMPEDVTDIRCALSAMYEASVYAKV